MLLSVRVTRRRLSRLSQAWEAVIGLETHVQLNTATKAFCGCRNVYGGEPNSNVCPVCLGLPVRCFASTRVARVFTRHRPCCLFQGSLPVLSEGVLRKVRLSSQQLCLWL